MKNTAQDIGVAFDRWFQNNDAFADGLGPSVDDLRAYFLWAFKGKSGEPPVSLSAEENSRAEEWLGRVAVLVDEAAFLLRSDWRC